MATSEPSGPRLPVQGSAYYTVSGPNVPAIVLCVRTGRGEESCGAALDQSVDYLVAATTQAPVTAGKCSPS